MPWSSWRLCACSARLGQVRGHFDRGHAILDLGVGDRSMLLSEMQAQLALMTEVQVAFLTLKMEENNGEININTTYLAYHNKRLHQKVH